MANWVLSRHRQAAARVGRTGEPSGEAMDAVLGTEAGFDRVVLTHLHPAVDDDSLASRVRAGYGGEVVVAEDGLWHRV